MISSVAVSQSRQLARFRDQLEGALREDDPRRALELYDQLEALEPTEPRWPHRRGDLLRRRGRTPDAIGAFERAVDAYAALGFVARAAALAKLVLSLDPSRVEVLERVDPEAARRLHREARGASRPRSLEKAAPLLSDARAEIDEVRFLDVEEDDAIELDLSDLELRATPPEIPALLDEVIFLDIDEAPRRASTAQLSLLPSVPLFAEVAPAALRGLLAGSDLVETKSGEVLFRAGDPADALYILCEGAAQVAIPGLAPLQLGEGEVLGESCLLDHVARSATVTAVEPTITLKVSKETLDALVAAHPTMGEVLLELLTRRLITNTVRTAPIFAGFDPATRVELASLFEVRRADEGTSLCEYGKRSDGLYAVLLGEVTLTTPDGEDRLGPGKMFGQASLLEHAPCEFDARAASDLLLLRLPRASFARLASQYPPVLAYLANLTSEALG